MGSPSWLPSRPWSWYCAFSRNGTFEGDCNQVASSGGYTYIVRCQGYPNTVVPTEVGKGHQHQSAFVALVQNKR